MTQTKRRKRNLKKKKKKKKKKKIPQVEDAGSAIASWQQGNNI